ncbi:MAG: hypothetical protein LBS20_01435, partial [Prevotella sp.]|nr:hypothetical protein [Prevotella sp.]
SGAMDWYNASVGVLAKQKSTADSSDEISYKPSGNLAELFTDELWYAVESPLDFGDRNLMIMTPEVNNYAETHGDNAAKQEMKLVVLRNKETGETYSFIMAVVPELDYMLRKGDELDKSTYLSPNSDFDGYIFFYTLDGELINGWLYKGGKVTGGINFSGEGPRTKILVAAEMVVRSCHGIQGMAGIECGWGPEIYYYDNGVPYVNGNPGVNIQYPYIGGGGGNGSNTGNNKPKLPLKPTPLDRDADNIPEKRTDCSGSATQNANDAQNATKSPDVQVDMSLLKTYAAGKDNEWATLIDFQSNKYKTSQLKEGSTGSVKPYPNTNTVYDVHTHPNDTREGYRNLTGFSMGDVYGALYTGGDAYYSIYKGSIVIAYDGSEYLLAVNDRAKIQKFWGNDANKELFKSGDNTYFKDPKMNTEYREIRNKLEDKGFSIDDANDYAMSYLLDKYDTGLKISKKEKGESSFKEMKTEKSTTTNDYKPTKCP